MPGIVAYSIHHKSTKPLQKLTTSEEVKQDMNY